MKSKLTHKRTLHLIDVENLSGGSLCTLPGVADTAREYLEALPVSEADLYVLATSCGNALSGYFGWPTSAQRLMRSGENGADLALLDAYTPNEIQSRFQRVVIGSGDGIFTELSQNLTALGVSVVAVSRVDCLSKRLRMAVQAVVLLPQLSEEVEANHAA